MEHFHKVKTTTFLLAKNESSILLANTNFRLEKLTNVNWLHRSAGSVFHRYRVGHSFKPVSFPHKFGTACIKTARETVRTKSLILFSANLLRTTCKSLATSCKTENVFLATYRRLLDKNE